MKIEVGKKYRCGDSVVEIIGTVNDCAYYYVGLDIKSQKVGMWHDEGMFTTYNPKQLQYELTPLVEEMTTCQGPLIKIEPGKIHPFLFVLLSDNCQYSPQLSVETVFFRLSCVGELSISGSVEFVGFDKRIINYFLISALPEENHSIFSLYESNFSKIKIHSEGFKNTIKGIYSDATEAYEAYKKEVENNE